MQRVPVVATMVLAFVGAARVRALEVGSQAPAVEPSEWLNTKATLSWKSLKGRLVLDQA